MKILKKKIFNLKFYTQLKLFLMGEGGIKSFSCAKVSKMLPPRHSFLESYWRMCFIQQRSKPRERKTQGPIERKGLRELLTPGNRKFEGDKYAGLESNTSREKQPRKNVSKENQNRTNRNT